jgi:hypothetical protein
MVDAVPVVTGLLASARPGDTSGVRTDDAIAASGDTACVRARVLIIGVAVVTGIERRGALCMGNSVTAVIGRACVRAVVRTDGISVVAKLEPTVWPRDAGRACTKNAVTATRGHAVAAAGIVVPGVSVVAGLATVNKAVAATGSRTVAAAGIGDGIAVRRALIAFFHRPGAPRVDNPVAAKGGCAEGGAIVGANSVAVIALLARFDDTIWCTARALLGSGSSATQTEHQDEDGYARGRASWPRAFLTGNSRRKRYQSHRY